MSVTPAPTHSIVPYQTPRARAIAATGTTATGFLIALGLLVLPIIGDFLRAGAFNRTALIALATAVGLAAVSVGTTYLIKLSQARGSDVPPSVLPDGTTPPQDAPAVFAPPITAASLRDLLEAVDVLQQWQRPVAPNAAIGHRPAQRAPVTEPPAPVSVPLGVMDAPVKRSHHAKPPAVLTPVDRVSDH